MRKTMVKFMNEDLQRLKSLAITICEDITAIVAAIPGAENAEMDLVPEYDLSQITGLKIVLAPHGYVRSNKGAADRSGPDQSVKIDLAIMKKCSNKLEIPDLLAFSETIVKGVDRKSVQDGFVTGVENDPLYDANIFRSMKVFITTLSINIKVLSR